MSDFKIHGLYRHRIGTDGQGVTTLAALAGCPAKCRYCLNKEVLKRTDIKTVSPEQILKALEKDLCYLLTTGGGITFGGGEPLLQSEAIAEFGQIRPAWMKLNIETSLQADTDRLKKLIPFVDSWIIDLKPEDPAVYEDYTGIKKELALRNLDLLKEHVPERCHIRIPDIQGYVTKEEADSYAEKIRQEGFAEVERFSYVIRE